VAREALQSPKDQRLPVNILKNEKELYLLVQQYQASPLDTLLQKEVKEAIRLPLDIDTS
jgi:hypothetical protein